MIREGVSVRRREAQHLSKAMGQSVQFFSQGLKLTIEVVAVRKPVLCQCRNSEELSVHKCKPNLSQGHGQSRSGRH